jgi:catechol 2,3-dioxygenase-like lactoylglutathione lyase family enzyme
MITGLDHVMLVASAPEACEQAYAALLGRDPDWRSNDPAGAASVIFQLDNTALEIMSPQGEGPLARRLHAIIRSEGEGLASLIFASDSLSDDHRLLARRAMQPDDITPGSSIDLTSRRARQWSRFRLGAEASQGVRLFLLQRLGHDPLTPRTVQTGAVSALDHVVIATRRPEQAAALYGARLGLRLALDRSRPDWDMRLLFFRTGGLTIELAHRLSEGPGDQPDRLWGLAWRTHDIEAAHSRLEAARLGPGPIRPGRRAGTRVFSLPAGALCTPTLVIAPA